ncbi:MAG: response regulator [Acidobacteria bacterium 13_1_20CM_2_68_7]|nr:MAG: response regulator [Acidobacteria bacterium 13_1_20CM_2_68_7]
MRILIAEDNEMIRAVLQAALEVWGHELVVCVDGTQAWQAFQGEDAPRLAILDWMMPGIDGPEICRKLRREPRTQAIYIILLTGKDRREDIVTGLGAGANDYVTKPFDHDELRARLQVGVRMVELQNLLANRVRDLEEAMARVKQLSGLLPICSYCKRVRDDKNYWQQVEAYIGRHSEAQFSHSICPECYETIVKPELKKHQSKAR